ncbi:L,D-transpeptidase family protein [Dethiobacter alkaliphilus]|uniref:ErfK/YbiS/YcfS/YnhG family protein n=1 Tax=Dethiobacter alkaliphilus AHT 1 TaxID=555088 RepID=C0GJB9_DETAL|nr:L,D-transpeptidase family protein [Dethiobacter alkaliphilus]EEG76604.1 ErfK/YbiS/YcfS/YnhG family protein [Dethiobacter alkaliphilus AHT 1]
MTRIEINRLMKKLTFYHQGQYYKTYPIAIGKPDTPTPLGEFSVYEKNPRPHQMLGTRWMAFTYQRHGIHGTFNPWTIGTAATAGCVRMYNEDVEELFPLTPIGTPVIIFEKEEKVKIPEHIGKEVYQVRPGDTVETIARRFRITPEQLIHFNKIKFPKYLHPGKLLVIPKFE